MMPWLSLTLQIDAAVAERFTQALLDAGAQAVSLENPQAGLQAVGALVGMNVAAGALVRDAASAAGLESAPAFRADQVEDQDWVRRSQAQFAPLEIGARLWIGPNWHEPPADGRAVVRLDPGLAFGTAAIPPRDSCCAFSSGNCGAARASSTTVAGRVYWRSLRQSSARRGSTQSIFEVAARYTAWFDVGMSSIDEGWGLIEGIRK